MAPPVERGAGHVATGRIVPLDGNNGLTCSSSLLASSRKRIRALSCEPTSAGVSV